MRHPTACANDPFFRLAVHGPDRAGLRLRQASEAFKHMPSVLNYHISNSQRTPLCTTGWPFHVRIGTDVLQDRHCQSLLVDINFRPVLILGNCSASHSNPNLLVQSISFDT